MALMEEQGKLVARAFAGGADGGREQVVLDAGGKLAPHDGNGTAKGCHELFFGCHAFTSFPDGD